MHVNGDTIWNLRSSICGKQEAEQEHNVLSALVGSIFRPQPQRSKYAASQHNLGSETQ